MVRFDADAVFGDDYLHFYGPGLTEERNRAEVEEICSLLGLSSGARILDAPCGHGRLANLLAGRGMVVTGVDASEAFLELARRSAPGPSGPTYLQGDLRRLPTDDRFDAVVCWFTSFGYFDDDENRVVLSEFRRVLEPGGVLLIETMHHDGFLRSVLAGPVPSVFKITVGDDLMVDETDFDPLTGRSETERTVVRDGQVRRSHFSVRLPTPPELVGWLNDAGFDRVSFSDRGGRPLTVQSRRLVVTAR
ncbi:MAG TPA: methyltransferase domain-containing protein [Acidimicrobiales bacterium]|nr:methyltransferase domain-containing protein [Acidimicrobiales bacterium]